MDDKMALYRECCFPNCANKVTILGFRWGDRSPPVDPPLIWLMLFLHEIEQVLVLVKHFTSASSLETFLSSRYYWHVSSFFQLVVCKRRNLVKAF